MKIKYGDIVKLIDDPDDDDSGLKAGDSGRVVFVDGDYIIVDWHGDNAGELYQPTEDELQVVSGARWP